MFQKSTIIERLFISAGLILLLFACLLRGWPAYAQAQSDTVEITPGLPEERGMTTGDNHTLKVRVNAGEYLRVVIEQIGIDIIITVLDPGGEKVVEVDNRIGAYGPEYVSVIAKKQGHYLLQLRTTPGRSNTGRYIAKIEALRSASPEDQESALAEKTFAEGRLLLEQSGTDPNPKKRREEALEKFNTVRSYWSTKKSARWEALALYNLGATHRRLSQVKEAAACFDKALELTPRLEPWDWRLTASILNDSGLNYTVLGQYSRAVESLTRALKMFQEKGDRRGEGTALINTGIAFYSANRMREGLPYFQKALPLRVEEKDRASEANILSSIGNGYDNLGEPHRALEYFDKAIKVFNSLSETEQARNARVFATALNNRALVYHTFGEWLLAIDSYQQALKIYQKLDTNLAVRTQGNIGKLYNDLGDSARAFKELTLAVEASKKIGDPTTTAEVLINLGEVKAAQGEPSDALTYFIEAREIGPTDRVRAAVLTNIGGIKILQRDPRSALDSYNEAIKLFRKIESVEGEATALQRRGEAYLVLGENTAAFEDFKQALAHANNIASSQGKIDALYGLARVERDRKNLDAAIIYSKDALKLIESQRTKVPGRQLRTSYFSARLNHYDLYIDLMMRQYQITHSQTNLAEALEASERARGRELVDLLNEAKVDLRKGIDPDLLKQEREVQQKLNAKAQAQMRLLSEKHSEEQAKLIAKEIDELILTYEDVKSKIQRSNPEYAQLSQSQSLNLTQIQQLLDDDTLLLEFFLGEERSYLWAVSRTSITADSLPARSEIERSALAFYKTLIQRGPEDVQTSRKPPRAVANSVPVDPAALSQMLLGPVADQFGKKRLVIVGDGVLQYLPFAALPSPLPQGETTHKASGRPYLMQEHEIVYLPSASVLSVLRTETAGRKGGPLSIAVLADPVFGQDDSGLQTETLRSGLKLVPLPATKREAQAIEAAIPPQTRTKIALGFDASRATVIKLQDENYRIVHFATHGDLNTEHPELSSVVLSMRDRDGKPQDGFLRLHDIYNLKLPADLIVLSACSTGLGRIIRGEGLIGLTRGFMHAGSPRVVASLWQVEDLGTSELMRRFYQHMSKEGMSPPMALRQSQMEMFKTRRWRSPYYWAGFVLQGEWKPIRSGQ